MNKGVVMEVHSGYAIILNNNGYLEKIALKNDMKVGQRIFYLDDDKLKLSNVIKHDFSSNKFMLMKAFGSIAAIFLIAFTFLFGLNMNSNKVYAVVSLDINPSIQIEADSNQIIIKAEGKNDDGQALDLKDIIGCNINTGIEKIKDKLAEKDYLAKNKEVLIAFALTKGVSDDSYKDAVETAVKDAFKDENITFVKADQDDIKAASDKGISLGRYKAFVVADTDTKENITSVPVKDITAIIKEKENCIYWKAQDIAPEDNTENSNSNISESQKEDINNKTQDVTSSSQNSSESVSNNNANNSNNSSTSGTTNNNKEKPVINAGKTEDKPAVNSNNSEINNASNNKTQTPESEIPSEDIKPSVPSKNNVSGNKN